MDASLLFFSLHVVGAVLWAISMAGGFSLFHSHFLSNRALPAVVAAVSLAGIATVFRKQPRWNSTLLLGLGVCWATAAQTTLLLFPESGVRLAIVGANGAAILIRSALRTHHPDPASTELSPNPGWGLPQNAIEFSLPDPASPANLFITLASTSVGRGFDSVSHAPGTYRNRIRIQPGPWRPTDP
jgi:hypothetical protein